MKKIGGECIPQSTPYYKQWLANGYTREDIYKEYILNNYVLPDVKSKLPADAKAIINSMSPSTGYEIDLMDNLDVANNIEATGAFFNNVFYFSDKADAGTISEETFHRIMQVVATAEERKFLLDAGAKLLNERLKLENKTRSQYHLELQNRLGVSKKEVEEYANEEEIAKQFVNYYTSSRISFEEQEVFKLANSLPFGEASYSIAKMLMNFFNKLKAMLGFGNKNRYAIKAAFEKIKSGAYSNNKVLTNPFLYTVPSYQTYSYKKDKIVRYVAPSTIQKLVANVAHTFKKYKNNNDAKLTDIQILNKVVNAWKEYYIAYPSTEESAILDSVSLKDKLKSDTIKYLNSLKQGDLSPEILELIENEEDEKGQSGSYFSADSGNEVDFKYSTKMKSLILNTGKEISFTNSAGEIVIVYKTPDPSVIYSGLVRAGSNAVSQEERLRKLVKFASIEGNENSELFIKDKILKDFTTSETTYTNPVTKVKSSIESVAAFTALILDSNFKLSGLNSTNNEAVENLNLVLKTFDLWSREMYIVAYDNTYNSSSGDTEVYSSNQAGAVKLQMSSWEDNYTIIGKKVPLEEFKESFKNILKKKSEIKSNLNIILKGLNIKLNPIFIDNYIKLIYKENSGDLTLDDVNDFNAIALVEFLDRFKTVIENSTEKYPDLYASLGESNEDFLSFFRAIAKGNALYDESILENSFKNIEKKTIYGFQWGTNTQKVVSKLKDSAFIEKLVKGNPYIGQTNNPDSSFFKNNPIVQWLGKNKNNSNKLSKITHFSIDGLQELNQKTKEGFSFSDLTYRDFATTMFSLFSEKATIYKQDNDSKNDQVFVPVTFSQNEAAKAIDFVTVPVYKNILNEKGKLTTQGINHIRNLIDLERERIKTIAALLGKYYPNHMGEVTQEELQSKVLVDAPIDIFKGYHTGKVLITKEGVVNFAESNIRGLQVTNNLQGIYSLDDVIKEFSGETINGEVVFGKQLTNEEISERYDRVASEYMKEFEAKGLITIEEGKFDPDRSLIPKIYYENNAKRKDVGFIYGDNEVDNINRNVKHAMLNMWLSSTYLNFIRVGDPMLNYKLDFTDAFKRGRVDNAAGISIATSVRNEKYNIDPITDIKFLLVKEPLATSDVNGKKNLELADGQAMSSVMFHLKTLYGLGRLNDANGDAKFKIWKELHEGLDSDPNEISDNDAYFQVLKTVTASGSTKHKFSMATLSKQDTAYRVKISKQEYDKHASRNNKQGITKQRVQKEESTVEELEVSWNLNEKNPVYYKWVPKPGKSMQALHERRLLLDGWRKDANGKWKFKNQLIDYYTYPSASKSGTKNILYDTKELKDDYHIQLQDADAYKLQLENPSGKSEVIDPTQLLEITLNELELAGGVVLPDGQVIKPENIKSTFQRLLSSRDKANYQLAVDIIFTTTKDANGKNIYTPNFTHFLKRLRESLQQNGADVQMLELLEEEVINGKRTGKLKYNQNLPLIKEKFMQLYFNHFSTGVLKNKVAGDSMAMISPEGRIQLKKIVKEEIIFNGKKKTIYSWQVIKRTDKDYAKIVEQYNSTLDKDGNPYDLSGLTYDIRNTLVGDGSKDKVSSKLAELYNEDAPVYFTDELRHNKPRIENGKILHFVSESLMPSWMKKSSGIPEGYRYQFGVRIPTQDKQSAVNIEWVDTLTASLGNSIIVPKEVAQLAGSDFDIDKIFVHRQGGKMVGNEFIPYKNTFADFFKYIFKKEKVLKDVLDEKLAEDDYYKGLNSIVAGTKDKIENIKKELIDISNEYQQEKEVEIEELKQRIQDINVLGGEAKAVLTSLTPNEPQEIKELEEEVKELYIILNQEKDLKEKANIVKSIQRVKFDIANRRYVINKGSIKKDEIFKLVETLVKYREETQALKAQIKSLYDDIRNNSTEEYLQKQSEIEITEQAAVSAKEEMADIVAKTKLEVMAQFNLPTNESEYSDKYKDGFSGYINNTMLFMKQSLLSSDSSLFKYGERGIYDSPATLDLLSNIAKEAFLIISKEEYEKVKGAYYKDDNYTDKNGKVKVYPLLNTGKKSIYKKSNPFVQLFSPVNMFQYQDAVQVGKESIAPIVNSNLLGIAASRIELKHNDPVIFYTADGETNVMNSFPELTTDNQRIYDAITTLITAATDEAKESQLAEHGITVSGLKAMSIMLLHGFPFSSAVAILQDPYVQTINNGLKKGTFETAVEKEGTKSRNYVNLFNGLGFGAEIRKINEAGVKMPVTLKEEDIYKSARGIKIEDEFSVARAYVHMLQSYDTLADMLPLIKAKGGLDKDLVGLDNRLERINRLDLYDNMLMPRMYNFSSAIMKNPDAQHMVNTLGVYINQYELANKVFTERTVSYRHIKSQIIQNVQQNRYLLKDTIDSIVESILVGGIIRKYGNDLKLDLLQFSKLNTGLIKGENTIIDRILAADEEVQDLFYSQFKLIPSINNRIKINRYVDKLAITHKGKITPEKQAELVDTISTIMSKDPDLAEDIFRYFVVKDGLQFKANSISIAMPSYLFEEAGKVFTFAMEKIQATNIFKDQEVADIFFSNITNKQFVKVIKTPYKKRTFEKMFNSVKVDIVRNTKTLPLIFKVDKDSPEKEGGANNFTHFIFNDILFKKINDSNYSDSNQHIYVPTLFTGNKESNGLLGMSTFVAAEEMYNSTDEKTGRYVPNSSPYKKLLARFDPEKRGELSKRDREAVERNYREILKFKNQVDFLATKGKVLDITEGVTEETQEEFFGGDIDISEGPPKYDENPNEYDDYQGQEGTDDGGYYEEGFGMINIDSFQEKPSIEQEIKDLQFKIDSYERLLQDPEAAGKDVVEGLLKEAVIKLRELKKVLENTNTNQAQPFEVLTLSKVPQAEKVKAPFKSRNSQGYIGFGKQGSSTEYYAQQYKEKGLSVNPETYESSKVYFASVNGDGTNRVETLNEIKKALNSGAKVLLDSKKYIDSSNYNKQGEGWIHDELKKLGFKNTDSTINTDVTRWENPNISQAQPASVDEYNKAVKEANSRPSNTNIPQNLQSGVEQYGTLQYANNEAQKLLGENVTSIELIENEFRTRTTRTDKELDKYNIKVGSYIKMFGKDQYGNTKNVIVKITKITKGYDDSTWYKEGWTQEGLTNLKEHTSSANAIEFEVIKPFNSINLNLQPASNETVSTQAVQSGEVRDIKIDQYTYTLNTLTGEVIHNAKAGDKIENNETQIGKVYRKYAVDNNFETKSFNGSNYSKVFDKIVNVANGNIVTQKEIKDLFIDDISVKNIILNEKAELTEDQEKVSQSNTINNQNKKVKTEKELEDEYYNQLSEEDQNMTNDSLNPFDCD
jgi:hypothetical protein